MHQRFMIFRVKKEANKKKQFHSFKQLVELNDDKTY
jgi:hypothetical protein